MKENKIHQCPGCGLHYLDKEIAKACEAWCAAFKSCNLEITKKSLEVQEGKR